MIDCWIEMEPVPQRILLHFYYNSTAIPHGTVANISQLLSDIIDIIYKDPIRTILNLEAYMLIIESIHVRPQLHLNNHNSDIEYKNSDVKISNLEEQKSAMTTILRGLWVQVLSLSLRER